MGRKYKGEKEMKRCIKIMLITLVTFAIWGAMHVVQADSMQGIDMSIYINKTGDAYVTEIWKCSRTEGTENYHSYYNIGKSKIKDVKVSEGLRNYRTIASWNSNASFEEKAYTCGVKSLAEGVEICWGVSEYGEHTYTVQYTITDFVEELTDSQMVYWTLIPKGFSNYIPEAHIKIYTDTPIPNTVGVWGYGDYKGLAYVDNGTIEMYANNGINSSEYMTILVQFPANTFHVDTKLDDNFQHYLELAQKGAVSYKEVAAGEEGSVLGGMVILLQILFSIGIVVVLIMGYRASKRNSNMRRYDIKCKKIPRNVPYYRDIPFDGNLMRAYYVGVEYGMIRNKTDILGAILLEWLRDSLITIEKKEEGTIFKRENVQINLQQVEVSDIQGIKNRALFRMLKEASVDGVLEGKEFETWCKKSYAKILSWFEGEKGVMQLEYEQLKKQGYITEKQEGILFRTPVECPTPQLEQQALELAGLKRFLLDYTLVPDREAIEVQVLENYLIYAQMLGIADKVSKQFEDIYPEILERTQFISYETIRFVHVYTQDGITEAEKRRKMEEVKYRVANSLFDQTQSARNYSSGGGGFSSGGGGGGSHGGGGGGGFR